MVEFEWLARCVAGSEYLWCTPASTCVVNLDGSLEIQNGVVIAGDAVTDEAAFKAAVAADLNVPVEELTLIGP